ncbi:hypothetical protein KSF_073030 [Reticulibacter mediterranei]|uniref:DUF2165 domain-containing protein n=1 Tax=Reticulibacter mediterranei TaxID=2778369 RepID=A0A8J3N6B8_9CHLR|nr:hypothetical protein [Reticulibacter mediterranei]GHO97255.1 hypothetical protein KSF_073030 [Reticulibacter mediterranei]
MPTTRRGTRSAAVSSRTNRSVNNVSFVNRSTTTGPAMRTSHPALFIVAVGIGFLLLWLVALMTQIQTNEAFITSAGQVDVYHPNWAVFLQLPNLILGNDTPQDAIATIFGWGIELVYLGFIIGAEVLHDSVARSGQAMARLFKTCSWVIVLFNGWADYNYGTFGGAWGHILFAAITSFIVGYFGTIGMYLIESGWSRA